LSLPSFSNGASISGHHDLHGTSGAADRVDWFQFLGWDGLTPRDFPAFPLDGDHLQLSGVGIETGDEDAIPPDAGRSVSYGEFSFPKQGLVRPELGWERGLVIPESQAAWPAKLRPIIVPWLRAKTRTSANKPAQQYLGHLRYLPPALKNY